MVGSSKPAKANALVVVIMLFLVFTEVQSDKNTAFGIYKNLFKVKRKDHITAIEHLLLMDSEEKQTKLIKTMIKTITKTLKQALNNLDKNGYKTNDSFPENVDTKEALSLVLENTALMTDIVVRFPFIAKRELRHQTDESKALFQSARDICRGSKVYDSDNEIILYSLGQELGLDPINETYSNPFHQRPEQVFESSEDRKKRHTQEKQKKKKLRKIKNSKKSEL